MNRCSLNKLQFFDKMDVKIVLLVFCLVIGKSVGQLRCYACSYTSSSWDDSCLTITDSTSTVDCPHQYCTILRQEFKDPPGVVASFSRGCEQEPDYLNHEIEDYHYKTYYRACTSDLCNTGNGIQSIAGGALSPTPVHDGANLLVPGTASTASTVKMSLLLLFILSALFI